MGQLWVGTRFVVLKGNVLRIPFFCAKTGFYRLPDRYAKMVKVGEFLQEYPGPVVVPRFINGTAIREMEFSCLNRFLRSLRSVEMTV